MPERFNEPSDVFRNHDLDVSYLPDYLHDWASDFGLEFNNYLEGFYTAPYTDSIVHTDIPEKPKRNEIGHGAMKMNFTWGSADSTTRWWNIIEENYYKTTHVTPLKHKFYLPEKYENPIIYLADPNDCIMVHERVIDRPSFLNVSQMHSTHNPSDQGRWSLSVFLIHKKDNTVLLFDDALELFRDLLNED
jgi:hypothetical protein